jgi:predicted nuclease of predicted toxin-antitoxin system
MKIKLDENMPSALAELLGSSGHNVSTVPEEQLSGAEDPVILKQAAKEGRLLMTFDVDFADIRSFPLGSHAGIIVFRLHDQRWAVLKEPAKRLIAGDLLERLRKGLAVVDEKRIRLRFKGQE